MEDWYLSALFHSRIRLESSLCQGPAQLNYLLIVLSNAPSDASESESADHQIPLITSLFTYGLCAPLFLFSWWRLRLLSTGSGISISPVYNFVVIFLGSLSFNVWKIWASRFMWMGMDLLVSNRQLRSRIFIVYEVHLSIAPDIKVSLIFYLSSRRLREFRCDHHRSNSLD